MMNNVNNEVLLSNKKHTNTLLEQTKTKHQETHEFKLNKQKETFSFSPPINNSEEGKWPLAVTSFETTNSGFKITDENSSFSITTPSHCIPEGIEEIVDI